MLCDLCGQAESHFLIGNQQTGDQIAACPADAARWGLDLARAVLDPEEITAIMLGAAPSTPDGEGAADAAAPKTEEPEEEDREEDPDEIAARGEPEVPATPAVE